MKTLKILFVEDNFFAGKACDWLKRHGYDVYLAKNISEAEDLLEDEGGFNVAIVDLEMDKRYLPENLQKCADSTLTGWVFYKNILRLFYL